MALLNNYDRDMGVKETINNYEIYETYRFLNLVLQSKVMKEVYTFLKAKGLFTSISQFKQRLYDLWFRSYYRSSKHKYIYKYNI